MLKHRTDSRALRQLAENLAAEIAEDFDMAEDEERDLATSLVRQWISYDGQASLILDGHQVYLPLGKTPLGRFTVVPEPAHSAWIDRLVRDWKIDPDDLPEVFECLNRAQSAEVVNAEGVRLRIWVNPRERSRGVEELDGRPGQRASSRRNYPGIAATTLEQEFGATLDPDELEALAGSVARQWEQYDGHAGLFLPGKHLRFMLVRSADGSCQVRVERRAVGLDALLGSLGITPERHSDAMVRLNLGQPVEFRDGRGVPSRLWHDPRTLQLRVQAVGGPSAGAAGRQPVLFCPKCSALLGLWREGEREQVCSHCGHTASV